MVHRVFLLNDRVAGELMTPMSHVVTLESGMSVHRAANRVADEPYTRFPVVDDDGEVLGIVISHDLLHGLVTDRRDRPIDSILRTPPVVDAGLRADELLEILRRRKVHLALVRSGDDTVGVVSLEDVLEELVGEIVDEREADRSE
jgi:CBS domain containing-hemolysin-like protein